MPAGISAVLGLVLLIATGLAAAASLRLRSLAELALAAFVLAFAEVVALVLLLSAFGAVRRSALFAGLIAACALAVGLWLRSGRARPDLCALRSASSGLRRSPPLLLLALVISTTLAYVVALIVGTSPNTWDSLAYHLVRAAFWSQGGSVGYIGDPYDDRLNSNPPNAEIALTFVLELTRDERLAGLVQLVAALAGATAVFALARRLGLARREAAFGGLLFLTLPIVVLQSSTTQNDLVVAALLLAATVFVLAESRRTLALAALATCLAVGTKVTAVYALPILVAVAVVASPRSARTSRIAAVAIGAVAGSYWYVVNLAETGRVLGRRPDTELLAVLEPRDNVLAALARVLDAFDLSGAEGAEKLVLSNLLDSDLFAYVLIALGLTAALLAVALTTRRLRPRVAFEAGALALLPLVVAPLGYVLWRVFAKLADLLDAPAGSLPVGEWPPQTTASETLSWFGPLGLFLVTGTAVASVVLHRRRLWTGLAVVLATAPLAWLVLFSASIGYDVWQGRFFVYPVALSAALWGVALRVPPVAWACVAIGATTVALSLVNSLEKPAGVHLFADRGATSVWGKQRWEVQSLPRPEMRPVLRFLEERVPGDESVALALTENDFGFPAFGRRLERQVELVPEGSRGRGLANAEWLVATPLHAPSIDRACWEPALTTARGWAVFRRTLAGCPQ